MALYGCGGSSSGTTPTDPTPRPDQNVPLPAVHTLKAGTLTIGAGKEEVRGGVIFSCAAGTVACTLIVEDSLGTLIARWTGAKVTAAPGIHDGMLPAGHARHAEELGLAVLAASTTSITIPAGGTHTVGGVTFTNNGTTASNVTIKAGSGDGSLVYQYEGHKMVGSKAAVSVDLMAIDLGYKAIQGKGGLRSLAVALRAETATANPLQTVVFSDHAYTPPEDSGGSPITAGPTAGRFDGSGTTDVDGADPIVQTVVDGADTILPDATRNNDAAGTTLSLSTHDKGGALFGDGINDVQTTVKADTTPGWGMDPFAGCKPNSGECKELSEKSQYLPGLVDTPGTPKAGAPNADTPRAGEFTVTSRWTADANAAERWKATTDKMTLTTDTDTTTIWKETAMDDANQLLGTRVGGKVVVDLYSDIDFQRKISVLEVTTAADNSDTDNPVAEVKSFSTEAAIILGLHSGRSTSVSVNGELLPSVDPSDSTNADWVGADNADWLNVSFEKIALNAGHDVTLDEDFTLNQSEPGTFKGVPGRFVCTSSAGCSIRYTARDVKRSATALSGVRYTGAWVFQPDKAAEVYSPDTDWLAVGVWITQPNDNLGDHEFGAFAFGSDPFVKTNIAALTGTAKYAGDAVGRYAENDGTKGVAGLTAGRFAASVALTADFGTDAVGGTISGSVTGFKVQRYNTTDWMTKDDWTLNLESTSITPIDDTSTPSTFTGNTIAEGQASGHVQGARQLFGVWNGRFYGNTVPHVAASSHPKSVAGTFAATDKDDTDGYSLTLGGAYGAHLVPPPADD